MTDFLSQLKLNIRLYDRQRGRERLVQHIEILGSIVYLSLRDPRTGEVKRLPFVISRLPDRFDIMAGAFGGSPELVRVVAEAHRLNHAYLFNPIFATETSLIDPLPHQLMAVYGLPEDQKHPWVSVVGIGDERKVTLSVKLFDLPSAEFQSRRSL